MSLSLALGSETEWDYLAALLLYSVSKDSLGTLNFIVPSTQQRDDICLWKNGQDSLWSPEIKKKGKLCALHLLHTFSVVSQFLIDHPGVCSQNYQQGALGLHFSPKLPLVGRNWSQQVCSRPGVTWPRKGTRSSMKSELTGPECLSTRSQSPFPTLTSSRCVCIWECVCVCVRVCVHMCNPVCVQGSQAMSWTLGCDHTG